MATMINDPTANEVDTLNMLESTSSPLVFTPFLCSYMLMIYIPITHTANTITILSMNGISNTPAEFAAAHPNSYNGDRSIQPGKNLRITETINPPTVANNAAFEVVFFQKKPKMNMAKIPGDTKPVYS